MFLVIIIAKITKILLKPNFVKISPATTTISSSSSSAAAKSFGISSSTKEKIEFFNKLSSSPSSLSSTSSTSSLLFSSPTSTLLIKNQQKTSKSSAFNTNTNDKTAHVASLCNYYQSKNSTITPLSTAKSYDHNSLFNKKKVKFNFERRNNTSLSSSSSIYSKFDYINYLNNKYNNNIDFSKSMIEFTLCLRKLLVKIEKVINLKS